MVFEKSTLLIEFSIKWQIFPFIEKGSKKLIFQQEELDSMLIVIGIGNISMQVFPASEATYGESQGLILF